MALIQCPTCGATVSDQAANCPKCGAPISSASNRPAYQQVAPTQQTYSPTSREDESNVGLNILSFFIPLVGWILWGVFKNESPIKAKACSRWAWIGFAILAVFRIILFAIYDEMYY